jgi:hypothetical protein
MCIIIHGDGSERKQNFGELHARMETFEATLRSVERRMPTKHGTVGIHDSQSNEKQFRLSESMVSLEQNIPSREDLATDLGFEQVS